MRDQSERRVTIAEYLALDATSTDVLEYRDGFVVALAVPTKNHARIAGNLATLLGPSARATGCDYFTGDVKVLTPRGDRLVPDFAITCDERDRASADEQGEARIRYPWLVVEILSPATAADDVTYKFDAYRSIETVTHYVVVDGRRRAMRVYARTQDGAFVAHGPVERIVLPHVAGAGLALDDVYRDTTVPRLDDLGAPLA